MSNFENLYNDIKCDKSICKKYFINEEEDDNNDVVISSTEELLDGGENESYKLKNIKYELMKKLKIKYPDMKKLEIYEKANIYVNKHFYSMEMINDKI